MPFENREGGCRVLQSSVRGSQTQGAEGRCAGTFVRLVFSGQIAAFNLDVHRKKRSPLPSTIKGSCLESLILTQKQHHISDVRFNIKTYSLGSTNDW